jgi:SSS family solute:Na+ symporter
VTPADFVRARFGSRALALLVAVTGIVATMPYIALQLIGVESVLATLGVPGKWPLAVAFAVLAVFTYHSGLRAPALIAFVKDILVGYVVLAILLTIGMSWNGWNGVFHAASVKFHSDGPLLPVRGQLGYVTLALGSALAIFLYPHAITGMLASKNRETVRRTLSALPIYTAMLGLVALLGFTAIAWGVKPIGGNPQTVLPSMLQGFLPPWLAGFAYAAIGVGALVPASVMSIATANLFARNIYREYLAPRSTPATELRVSKLASLVVKFGAACFVLVINPQFSVDLQLIGSVVILQTLPAVGLGLYTSWFHRRALVAGILVGLVTGIAMLYETPQLSATGHVVRAHFGGSSWSLAHIGIHNGQSIYIGLIALAVNLLVTVGLTPVLRAMRVPDGLDITWKHDYEAEEGDPSVRRMSELVDGGPLNPVVYEQALPRHGQVPGRSSTVDRRVRR